MFDTIQHLAGENLNRILTKSEEYDAACAWRDHGDEAARSLILGCHVKLVWREVKRMRHYQAEAHDMISEGMIGMVIALDKFDPEAGFRFSTYAMHWIRATLADHAMLSEGTLRGPRTTRHKKIFFSARKAYTEIKRRAMASGAPMNDEEIQTLTAKALGVCVQDLRNSTMSMTRACSLDAPTGTEGDTLLTLGDTIPDPAPGAEDILTDKTRTARITKDVRKALDVLTEREQRIILARKLSGDEKARPLRDLAHEYNISSERVRQIEVKALAKLKSQLRATARALEIA